ncbi:MAG: hypothetical protein KF752_11965 [Pirellulaceae bacterium]|nr:hypothetical protein [Pirellulaceae bacterium]
MPIITPCTGCGAQLTVADEHAGKRARCPSCGNVYTVPSSGSGSEAPASTPELAATPTAQSPATTESPIVSASDSQTAQPIVDSYWLLAADGQVYGPTDRDTLNRWFHEGRIGAGYRIRQGEAGPWTEAHVFHPANAFHTASGNPYAVSPTLALGSGVASPTYAKPDRGVLVLVMGILSFVVCGLFSIIAVVMGARALKDIQAGLANPNDKTMVQIGFWLGVVNLVLHLLVIALIALAIIIPAISQ